MPSRSPRRGRRRPGGGGALLLACAAGALAAAGCGAAPPHPARRLAFWADRERGEGATTNRASRGESPAGSAAEAERGPAAGAEGLFWEDFHPYAAYLARLRAGPRLAELPAVATTHEGRTVAAYELRPRPGPPAGAAGDALGPLLDALGPALEDEASVAEWSHLLLEAEGAAPPPGAGRGAPANASDPAPPKKRRAVLVNGGQHAREWLAVAATACAAEELARTVEDALLEDITLVVVPVMNPDGYEWSRHPEGDRLWRKNRRPAGLHECAGVDLNRNWPVDWAGEEGNSRSTCSIVYTGPAPLSEPESAGFVRWLDAREAEGYEFVAHLDVHSYSQIVLGAWSHTTTDPNNITLVETVADVLTTGMAAAHGTEYAFYRGNAGGNMPLASGTMQDYMHGARGINSYTVELPPSMFLPEHPGFLVSPDTIQPACEELAGGIEALLRFHAVTNVTELATLDVSGPGPGRPDAGSDLGPATSQWAQLFVETSEEKVGAKK